MRKRTQPQLSTRALVVLLVLAVIAGVVITAGLLNPPVRTNVNFTSYTEPGLLNKNLATANKENAEADLFHMIAQIFKDNRTGAFINVLFETFPILVPCLGFLFLGLIVLVLVGIFKLLQKAKLT